MNVRRGTALINNKEREKEHFYTFRLISDSKFKSNLTSLISCQQILREKKKQLYYFQQICYKKGR
jgi:hypothetical protein